jgi:site-specific DNA recombinase
MALHRRQHGPTALQRLGRHQAGKVDCVIVYKVDRLSRSLLTARLMETFESAPVAFVSVTQLFNTASAWAG